MTHEQDDRKFDALLRDLGPDVPQPQLQRQDRARLLALIAGRDASPVVARVGPGRGPWLAAASLTLIASLALWCALLSVRVGRLGDQLSTSRWETGEALELLFRARRTQPIIPVPDDLEGLTRDDLVLITFHHDLCPIARICTPGFRSLAQAHADESQRFLTLDVTGARRDHAQQEIDALGMGYALLAPLGAETGVVKVLDTRRQRVLSSAPGRQGLEQAEMVLARVPN